MSKTLLVLAASTYQLDTIRTAKRLGYRVITTDNRPENPGHALADRAYNADTTDVRAVLQIARAEKIDGVISPCTDVAVPTAADVAHELGLVGVSPDAARILTDKIAFRRFQRDEGLPAPDFFSIPSDVVDLPSISWQDSPWILKPDFSSGSKGIFIVRNEADLISRIPESRAFSSKQTVLLERFIEGHQATCEGILKDGRICMSVVLDRQTAAPPYVTTTGHHLPTKLEPDAIARLQDRLEQIWARLGVTDGPFDCDFVWANDEVYILETTPRLGGNSISQLLRLATGFDLVEYAVGQACGLKNTTPSKLEINPCAVVLLGVWRDGLLKFDVGQKNRLMKESWVASLKIDYEPGAYVKAFINGRNRLGEAYVTAGSRSALDNRVFELRRFLAMDIVTNS